MESTSLLRQRTPFITLFLTREPVLVASTATVYELLAMACIHIIVEPENN